MKDSDVALLLNRLYKEYDLDFDEEQIMNILACKPSIFKSQMADLGIQFSPGTVTITAAPPKERSWVVIKLQMLKRFNQ